MIISKTKNNLSNNFIKKLESTRNNSDFVRICIEEHKIPPQISTVPTIIVPNHPTSLSGDNVFRWLEQNSEPLDDDISAYASCEMKGYSDKFSFIDNDKPIDHNFSFVEENLGGTGIITPNEDELNESSRGRGGGSFDMDKIIAQRNNEIPSMIKRV